MSRCDGRSFSCVARCLCRFGKKALALILRTALPAHRKARCNLLQLPATRVGPFREQWPLAAYLIKSDLFIILNSFSLQRSTQPITPEIITLLAQNHNDFNLYLFIVYLSLSFYIDTCTIGLRGDNLIHIKWFVYPYQVMHSYMHFSWELSLVLVDMIIVKPTKRRVTI